MNEGVGGLHRRLSFIKKGVRAYGEQHNLLKPLQAQA